MKLQTIVLTGPESTGKTTLTRELADHFQAPWAPEFARGYISELGRPYDESDLLTIAKGQVNLEKKLKRQADQLLILDTSLEVIKIWSEVKFDHCHPWILNALKRRKHDLYLLCQPDTAWVFDQQRENPADRDLLFELYKKELIQLNVTFVELNGLGENRIQSAINHVRSFITNNGPTLHP